MLPIILLLLFIVTKSNALSIGVKESDITKRESIGDFFPDWVPFKNKHGEELGEFIDVPKPKPKKRLAPPMNFMLKGADKESSYDDKEEDFNDDYYDVHTPASDDNSKNISHTDIAGIDTIVNIITKPSKNLLIKPLVNLRRTQNEKLKEDTYENFKSVENDSDIYDDQSEHVSEKEHKINSKEERDGEDYHQDDGNNVDHNSSNSGTKENDEANKDKTKQKNINHYIKEEGIARINQNNESFEAPSDSKISGKNEEDTEDHSEWDKVDNKNEDKEDIKDDYYEQDNVENKEEDKMQDIEKEKSINQSDYKIKDKKEYKEDTSKEDKEDTSKEEKEDTSKKNKEHVSKEEKEHEQDDEISEKQRQEDEAKKAKILSSVDELKERHAKEQRRISERVKDEEILREERIHDRYRSDEDDDKYGKRSHSRWINAPIEDDEYQEEEDPVFDKYKIKSYQSISTTTKKPVRTKKRKTKNKSAGKLSNFRNADAYLFDEDSEKISEDTGSVKIRSPKKFSARYSVTTTPLPEDDIIRISLVPQTVKDDDVKDYFRKKSKSKRKHKSTPAPELDTLSSVEVVKPISTSPGATASDTDPSASDPFSSISNTAPSAPDAVSVNFAPSASNSLSSDTVPAESETAPSAADTGPSASETELSVRDAADSTHASSNKEVEKKSEDYHSEKGGGKQHDSEHEEEHEEHGKKAYEGIHKETKTRKGHHDKEDHHGKYDDHGGVDKQHHEEDGHYGDHHHEEHGKKFAKYEESGKHSKGHSTKGSHDIHKKDEYEKKVEFFEEEGDSAEEEKHGGHHDEKGHKSGGHYKKSNLQAAHKGHHKGEKGHFNKNGFDHYDKGHKSSGGHDGHGRHAHTHLHKEAGGGGKKWIYHHGHPARTANLVVIDRRQDRLQHGPVYYG